MSFFLDFTWGSYIHGFLYAALCLSCLRCSSTLLPGVTRDWPDGRDGVLVPFHYFTFYYLKVTNLWLFFKIESTVGTLNKAKVGKYRIVP